MKQFSEACERNKDAILNRIKPILANKNSVLEVGSGTGQHAAYFAQHLSHLDWQTSDLQENHSSILAWLTESKLSNLLPPIHLDTTAKEWPAQQYDAIFSANTLHIMPWYAVEAMFNGVEKVISNSGDLLIYGPFNYDGQFTSESNQQFDLWLKQINPERGIRDFEQVSLLAEKVAMQLENDFEMPANNRLLHFKK
jgi:cyclopropane fatty-acyl-phospholipid synthase-like methyltransferase